MTTTMHTPKDQLVKLAQQQMLTALTDNTYTVRQKLALTCRILFDGGHDSGLAGQITARAQEPGTYYTQQLGLGFDEIAASNLLVVDEDLTVLQGHGMANPANRFHSWLYRARPDVNCIIHTHPLHSAALSMLEVPLAISHMDLCPLFDDCAFLKEWPGVPVGNEEGEIIANAIGDKRAILLSHHGLLIAGRSIEEAACSPCCSSAQQRCNCWPWAPVTSAPSPKHWAKRPTTGFPPPNVTVPPSATTRAELCVPMATAWLIEAVLFPQQRQRCLVMSTPVIRGVIGYTITPFTADGSLDLDALGTSIDSLIADGVHAIAPLGSTGEGAYLSDSEWETVVRFSQARIAGRVPSVVSVSDLTTARTVQRARLAQACGATAVMVLPISYWKLTEAEVVAHYKAVGAAIDIPIMLYNNPGTSGTDLSVELILRILGEVPTVTMVKESTGDIQRMHRLFTATDGQVAFYNGCNPLTLEALVAGATGWCTAAPNLIPALNLALWDAVQQGDLAEARALFYRQYELLEYITRRGLPTTIKAGLKMLGQEVGAPRLPLQPLDAQGSNHLKNLLVALAN